MSPAEARVLAAARRLADADAQCELLMTTRPVPKTVTINRASSRLTRAYEAVIDAANKLPPVRKR